MANFTTFASSDRTKLTYLPESVWAQMPTAGSPREMRIKSSKLTMKKETKMSDEIRADRMVPSIIEVGAASEGEVDFEFSAGAVDDFLAAFVYGAFTRPMTMDFWQGNVAVTANNSVTISSSTDFHNYFVPGRFIKLEGFVNTKNNGYHTIVSAAFAGGLTTVVVAETNLVVETASAFTSLFDANDVLVLNSTAIRFGTGGAATIDSNGTNAFASAIAAGQLVPGQKIAVDGLGFETGTITFTAAPAAGDTISINDTVAQIVLESGQGTLSGALGYNPGATAATAASAVALAINEAHAAGLINVVAKAVADVVTLANLQRSGGLVSSVQATAVATIVNFAGGDDSVRGVFTIVGVTSDVLTVSPAPDLNANATNTAVTIKGSMLRNPSRPQDFVPASFAIETSYEDVNQYFVNKGLRVSQFDLDVQSREIVTGKIAFKGEAMTRNIAQVSTFDNAPFTPLVATPGQIMSATTNVGSITKNGMPLATAIKSITISGDASLREQQAVGYKFPVGIGTGRFKITGKFAAYFENGSMFDDFIAHNTVSLSWYFLDLDNQRYDITLPAIKLTEDPLSPGSLDQDVMEDISWEAQRDPATNSMIQIDRFSSVKAHSDSF